MPCNLWLFYVFISRVSVLGNVHEECSVHPGSVSMSVLQKDRRTSRQDIMVAALDFASGTYRITKPGTYKLTENIVFQPGGESVEETLFPKSDSKSYPQLAGYFLGFFAAVAVEADDVTLDCQGHEIKMSEEFHAHQRFFSIIELGSKPFISGAGPPQFANGFTTPGQLIHANRVTIRNCVLGLSSHHGIHGNENTHVTLENLRIKDFEVGGVSLNGANHVVMEKLDVGPSLKSTFEASLSQAIFLDHLANTILPQDKNLELHLTNAKVQLRGKPQGVKMVFQTLRSELLKYQAGEPSGLDDTIKRGILPDGSAVYGVLLHKTGPAVEDFGACPEEMISAETEANFVLKDIKIHDLALNADQVIRMLWNGKQVMGPAGDVIRLDRVWGDGSPGSSFQYLGNPLSDAQVAMQSVKNMIQGSGSPLLKQEAQYFFGAIHVPEFFMDFAAGKTSFPSQEAILSWLGSERVSVECNRDAMSHFNKGAVGMRLEFVKDVTLEAVSIEDIVSKGTTNAVHWLCKASVPYKGGDVRGVSMSHTDPISTGSVTVKGLSSDAGATMDFALLDVEEAIAKMRTDDV